MTTRFIFHVLICLLLAMLGYWFYLQLSTDTYNFINAITVASYWFGYLIFILSSWLFYWILHKRTTKSWIVAQFFSIIIAVISTLSLVIIAHDHEDRRQADEGVFILKNEFNS